MGVMMSSKMGIEKFGDYIGNKLVAEGSWLDKQTEKNTATDIENKKRTNCWSKCHNVDIRF